MALVAHIITALSSPLATPSFFLVLPCPNSLKICPPLPSIIFLKTPHPHPPPAVSMPGMMNTILNLGLNDEIVQGVAAK
jgi:hypothetical protein